MKRKTPFSVRIRYEMEKQAKDVEYISAKTGISTTSLYRYFAEPGMMTMAKLEKICMVLRLNSTDIYGECIRGKV